MFPRTGVLIALGAVARMPATFTEATVVALGGSTYMSKITQNGVDWETGQMLGHASIESLE